MVRRVHREGVLLLGGGRALLMQIAHPLVARGVAEHSNFRAGRFDRLVRTLRPMFAIAYGSKQQAIAAAASVNQIHESVTGGGYRAADPDLLLWVMATLIDTTLYMHERFVRPLTAEEAAAYYIDMSVISEMLGLEPAGMAATIDGLRQYVEGMTASLVVTDEARQIANALFRAGPVLWPVMAPTRMLTAGLLDERLRHQFGLPWGPRREGALNMMAATSRAVLPHVPGLLKGPPWFVMP
jgi:uncharacterized protein (DUF2236 family)